MHKTLYISFDYQIPMYGIKVIFHISENWFKETTLGKDKL